MDNFYIQIRSTTKENLLRAFQIAFASDGETYQSKAKHVVSHPKYGLIFLSWGGDHVDREIAAQAFDSPLDAVAAAEFAWNWLSNITDADRLGFSAHDVCPDEFGGGIFDDEDISIEGAFLAYTQAWGHVGEYHGAIIAVRPEYAWFGK